MPNDPLPLLDVLAASQSADYEAVYAAIAATETGRNFLTEYARRHGHQDAHKFVSTIARLDSVARDGAPEQDLAALAAGFADLAAAIQRIEAVLSPDAHATPDVHFAVERIQDIATAVRSRGVEAALCDSLGAAIREVGDAIVRGDAAAGRAVTAAHLLRDLAGRVENMTVLVARAPSRAPERFDDTAPQTSAGSADDPGELFEPVSPPVSNLPEAAPGTAQAQAIEPSAASLPPRVDGDPNIIVQSRPGPRAVLDDALAPLLALSEEELLALFS